VRAVHPLEDVVGEQHVLVPVVALVVGQRAPGVLVMALMAVMAAVQRQPRFLPPCTATPAGLPPPIQHQPPPAQACDRMQVVNAG